MMSTTSYLICATPRTGSSLLCRLLESTGVAGHPESYFRQPDEQMWAKRWGLDRSPNDTFAYTDFVQAAISAGRTKNGVFAARLMWGTLDELVDNLGAIYPDIVGGDLGLLSRAFGQPRFVYLRRDDVVAQAVSWLRAEQTNLWHKTSETESEQPEHEPHFDFDKIHELVQTINEHNAAWQKWFASVGIAPHLVRYEDLDTDPVGLTRGVLEFLELELPPERKIVASNKRLADRLSSQWISRYQAELTQSENAS